MPQNTKRRVLAIDPGTRHLGVAVLAGDRLLYHAVKTFPDRRPADTVIKATRRAILRLIETYKPNTLAYEKTFFVYAKRSALLLVQEAEIQRVGTTRGLTVVGYSPTAVRRHLCQNGRATKREVAVLLVKRFPGLAKFLSVRHARKQRHWEHMFDALAVAVVCRDLLGVANSLRDRARVE